MRGYFSFVLAVVSTFLVVSLLLLYQESSSYDLSRAAAVERSYGVAMNVKEIALLSALHGAGEGFSAYDGSHSLEACMHCPDSSCIPYVPPEPPPPNFCSAEECLSCFREAEARSASSAGALLRLGSLRSQPFDPAFGVELGEGDIEVFLKSSPEARNGLEPDYIRFREPLGVEVSSDQFGVFYSGKITRGTVVRFAGPD